MGLGQPRSRGAPPSGVGVLDTRARTRDGAAGLAAEGNRPGTRVLAATRRWPTMCRKRRRCSTSSSCCWTAPTSSSRSCSTVTSGRTSSPPCSRRWRPGASWSSTPTCGRMGRSTGSPGGGVGAGGRPGVLPARPPACSPPALRISRPPQTLEELGVSLQLMETLQHDLPNLETQIPPIHEQFTILEKYEVPVQENVSSRGGPSAGSGPWLQRLILPL